MRKKYLTFIGAGLLALTVTATTIAASPYGSGRYGRRFYSMDLCPIRDESGNFFERDVFESNLDKAIEDGLIEQEYKDYYLEMYDYCLTGGGCYRGCGRGFNY